MPETPVYLDPAQTTEAAVRARLLARVLLPISKRAGGFLWDALNPDAQEFAMAADLPSAILEQGLLDSSYGDYLDSLAVHFGETRNAPVPAKGSVTLTGTNGTVVPAGFRVGTPTVGSQVGQAFTTDADATIGAGGTVAVGATAEVGGVAGNVAAGTISLFLQVPPAGLKSVTNPAAFTGGVDQESDADFRTRLKAKAKQPGSSGNQADYVKWAQEAGQTEEGLAAGGVGGASALLADDLPAGTPENVRVAIINAAKAPASDALVDVVLNYIADPISATRQAENMTVGGFGTSISPGVGVVMVYDAGGPGTIRDTIYENGVVDRLKAVNQNAGQPGDWIAKIGVRVDSVASALDLMRAAIWDVALADERPARYGEAMGGAVKTVQADDLGITTVEVEVPFYWDGAAQIELQIDRLQTDTTTTLTVDYVIFESTFSNDNGSGRAPGGARVKVVPATPVSINLSATLQIASGFDAASVKTQAEANFDAYLKSLAFAVSNDVIWSQAGNAIQDTPGVIGYSNLLLNGAANNVVIGPQEIAVKGTVTLT